MSGDEMMFFPPRTGIKRVQRGASTGAGTATINAVDTSKSFILSKSKGSSGCVAARGSLTMNVPLNLGWDNDWSINHYPPRRYGGTGGSEPSNYEGWPPYSGSITGGSTDLTVKEYSAVLTNSTTVTFDGPVEWQVIEFY